MSVTLTHRGLPGKMNRNGLLKALDGAGPKLLMLSCTEFRLLKRAICQCRMADFLPGRICGTFESPETLARELGVSRKVLDNAEKGLEAKGWLRRTWTLRGRRSGSRKGGVLRYVAGLNLAPMIDNVSKLVIERAKQASVENDAKDLLRAEIGAVWAKLCGLEDRAVHEAAHGILPRGRKSRISDIEKLRSLKRDLLALLAAVTDPPGETKGSNGSEVFDAPTQLDSNSDTSGGKPQAASNASFSISPARASALASDDYQVSVEMSGGPSWPVLIQVSQLALGWNQISHGAWAKACQVLGRERAALCILVIDRNRRRQAGPGKAKNAEACLAGMARCFRTGHLDLGCLLQAKQPTDHSTQTTYPLEARTSEPGQSRLQSLVANLLAEMEVTDGLN